MLNSNKSIDLKGLGYYIRFFYYIKPFNKAYRYSNKKCKTTILLYCKIPFKTLKKRIAKDLNKLGINKDLIESFCSEIKEQLEKVCYNFSDLCKSKRKNKKVKKLAHIEKKTKSVVAHHFTKNGIRESELMFYSYLYGDILGCKIVDKKPIELLLRIRK